jgi:hypothetical protein
MKLEAIMSKKISYTKNTGSAIEDLLKVAHEDKNKEAPLKPTSNVLPQKENIASAEINFSARELRYLREIDAAIQNTLNGNTESIVKQSKLWVKSGFSEVTWRKYVKILIEMGRYKILKSTPQGTVFSTNSSINL